jgi:hypothetical protein
MKYVIVAERKGRITPGQFATRLAAILASCPDLHETRPLIARTCLILASVTSGFRLSFYDALYVALAEREGCDLGGAEIGLIGVNSAPSASPREVFPFRVLVCLSLLMKEIGGRGR